MPTDDEINDLATTFVAKVQARYRWATCDESSHALEDDDAIVRANDLPFDYEKSDLYDEAVSQACVLLEPAEGVMPRWVPRTNKLSFDADDDIETLANIFAHKAIAGYEPVPYQIVKEAPNNNVFESSEELVANILDSDAFTSEVIFQRVFDATCAIVDEWNESNGGLWWPKTEPEPPENDLFAENHQ
jgi:uncharacterized protein YacL (UPF0231 family)